MFDFKFVDQNIKEKKKIIAHRGLCSIFPQNTKQAIATGILTADLTQFDVHLTKDQQIIVFHDRYLSRVTNICEHKQFLNRFKQEQIDDYKQIKSDWWVRDFTLNELRRLKVVQPIKYRPQLEHMNFRINTLTQIIQQCLKIKNQNIHKNLNSGLLIEIKEEVAGTLTQRDKTLCKKLVQILKKYNLDSDKGCIQNNLPIIIQSFNIPLLSCIQQCQNKMIQLYDKDQIITEQMLMKNKCEKVKGIGVTQKNLLNQQGLPDKRVGELCLKLNYQLFYWTIRDDDLNSRPFSCETYYDVYRKLDQIGITGFITEFPDKCKGYLGLQSTVYSKGNTETQNIQKNDYQRKTSQCSTLDNSYQQQGQKLMNI